MKLSKRNYTGFKLTYENKSFKTVGLYEFERIIRGLFVISRLIKRGYPRMLKPVILKISARYDKNNIKNERWSYTDIKLLRPDKDMESCFSPFVNTHGDMCWGNRYPPSQYPSLKKLLDTILIFCEGLLCHFDSRDENVNSRIDCIKHYTYAASTAELEKELRRVKPFKLTPEFFKNTKARQRVGGDGLNE